MRVELELEYPANAGNHLIDGAGIRNNLLRFYESGKFRFTF